MDNRNGALLLGAGAVALALIALQRRGTDVTTQRAHASRTVTIRAGAMRLYDLFRTPERLGKLAGGAAVEVVADRPGERYEWRTAPHGPFRGGGSLTFAAAPGDRGTQARLALYVEGPLAQALTKFERVFGASPAQLAMETLRDFKAIVEAGEVPRAVRA